VGEIGWCHEPYTTPSTIRYARRGSQHFDCRSGRELVSGCVHRTMAQLLIAIETGAEPAISGRDNLKTMALVEAAYLSAGQHRRVSPAEIQA